MSHQSSKINLIIDYRESLVSQVSKPIQFPEPGLRLNLTARQESQQRMFKHLHQSGTMHSWNFSQASKIKHIYLIDAYISMVESKNPLGIYMSARSMLEFNAFLHEIAHRLINTVEMPDKQWIDAGKKFFSIIVRARFATSRKDHNKLLENDGLPEKLRKPLNITNCIKGLSQKPDYKDVSDRYSTLCDYVHHNLGSQTTANDGTTIASAAWSSGGGALVGLKPGPVTQYQYPVQQKDLIAIEETSNDFLLDAKACVRWINEIPDSPYSTQQIRQNTGSDFGFPSLVGPNENNSKQHIGRNDPCPCGSGKKYKKCCSN